jgi:mannose/cellobiose epimerase-like protein (N-acyl-D-glucosamine 2-epimerase family)
MQRQAILGNNPIADAAFAASRQVWLASLGAAAVTRDWARHEAGKTFRTLVREGSAVEKQAIRMINDRVETSIATASSLWKQTRATALTTATTLAETASSALSKLNAPVTVRSTPAVKATKRTGKRVARRAKRASRKA